MGEKIKTWLPTILAVVSLIADLALDIFNTGIHVALWISVVLLLVQIVVLQRELVEIKDLRPNVIVDGFKLERPFHLIRNGKPEEILERYYLMFRNIKERGKPITDTKPIHAIVTYYDTECNILDNLSHEEPFWLDRSGPPWERSDDFCIVIKASSKPEGLCLVVRQEKASDLYAFCDKSYISNFRTLEPFQGSLRIPDLKVFVKVQLAAENLDMEPVWISITNRSEREQPLFPGG